MPTFAYQAVDPSGKRLRGLEEASTVEDLTRSLEGRKLLVLQVREPEGVRLGEGLGRRRGVVEATRAMASLLAAGLPLARALEVAEGLAPGPVSEAFALVRGRVQRGDALHTALADHPRLFPPHSIGVVRSGERSGDLATAFSRLEAQLEREQALRTRLLSASIYPLILAIVGGVAVVLLTLFVLPRFAELLADAGASLPASTATLLDISQTALAVWPALVIGPPLVVVLTATWLATKPGRRAASQLILSIPGLRRLRRDALAARFARLVAVLIGGGAPLLEALRDAGESMGDPIAREEVEQVRFRVREGAALHGALAGGTVFPALLPRLVAVGEESGRLEEFLDKAGELFETRVTHATERLASLAEPVMILVFGAFVGLVAMSLLQAVYGVNAGALG